jgi:hypothetical protein
MAHLRKISSGTCARVNACASTVGAKRGGGADDAAADDDDDDDDDDVVLFLFFAGAESSGATISPMCTSARAAALSYCSLLTNPSASTLSSVRTTPALFNFRLGQ